MERQWPTHILLTALKRQIKTLDDLAEEVIIGNEHLSSAPIFLKDLLQCVIHLVEKYLPEAQEDHMQLIAGLLSDIGEHLRYIERSRFHQNPWSLVPALELLAHSHVSKEAKFIFRPKWAYNYEISADFIQFYRKSLEGFSWIPKEERDKQLSKFNNIAIHAVSFPRVELLNSLLHVNFGHELGHLIANKYLANNFQKIWHQIESAIRKEISSEIPAPPVRTQQDFFRDWMKETYKETGVGQAREMAENGLKELIADAVGIHLFSMPALVASSEVAARFDLDESPIIKFGYPPWRYRLRLMLKQAKKDFEQFKSISTTSQWANAFIELIKDIQGIVANEIDIMVLKQNPRTSIFYNLLDDQWETIRAEALNLMPTTGNQPYQLFKRHSIIKELVIRLEDLVTPNETGPWDKANPADMCDTLAAGWIRAASIIKKQKAQKQYEEIDNVLRLVLKGVEMSYWAKEIQESQES